MGQLQPVWRKILALPLVLVLLGTTGATFSAAFRFSEDLTPTHCQHAFSPSSGELAFCLLADKNGRAIMPAVFKVTANGEKREIWRDMDRGFHPWRLQVAELDGDAEPEIAIGVSKPTRYDPVERKRLFIYDWTGNCLFAKWLGSRLAALLEDFRFTRPDAESVADHLFTVEIDGAERILREYSWMGFGFRSERILIRAPLDRDAELLSAFQQIGIRRENP